jgi:hypothetical protein
MIETALISVGVFASGVAFGYELHRRARAGQPVVGKKKNTDVSPTHRPFHPGSRKL